MIMLLRVLERLHGHLGMLSVAALVHPAIVLRNPKRRARLSVALSSGLVTLTALLGSYIYPEYRARIKQHIFIEAPRVGWLFERKEHLAVGAVAFALVGAIAHFAGPSFPSEAGKLGAAKLAHRALVASCVLSLLVGVLGVAVASYKTF